MSVNQVRDFERQSAKEVPQYPPHTLSDTSSSPDSFRPINACGSSTCMVEDSGMLKVGATSSPDVSDVPLAADSSRMEMRLFKERRSVLEYLCQHVPTVRSLDIYGQ